MAHARKRQPRAYRRRLALLVALAAAYALLRWHFRRELPDGNFALEDDSGLTIGALSAKFGSLAIASLNLPGRFESKPSLRSPGGMSSGKDTWSASRAIWDIGLRNTSDRS